VRCAVRYRGLGRAEKEPTPPATAAPTNLPHRARGVAADGRRWRWWYGLGHGRGRHPGTMLDFGTPVRARGRTRGGTSYGGARTAAAAPVGGGTAVTTHEAVMLSDQREGAMKHHIESTSPKALPFVRTCRTM